MKNPEHKPLKIIHTCYPKLKLSDDAYVIALSNLAIAESNLVRGGKDSALPHFLAIVKELEQCFGIKFEIM